MHKVNDADFMFNCYFKLRKIKVDKTVLKGQQVQGTMKMINQQLPVLTSSLNEYSNISFDDNKENVLDAKKLYFKYLEISRDNPNFASQKRNEQFIVLLKEVCSYEAIMIKEIRKREIGGNRIDLSKIFNSQDSLLKLGTLFAGEIIEEQLYPASYWGGEKCYISEKGKKFHMSKCPYCKNKTFFMTSINMVQAQGLEPCKCWKQYCETDHSIVTVFIDESIKPVMWDKNGQNGSIGIFSYVMCWGKLFSENEIRKQNLVCKGVDRGDDCIHIEKLTCSAIGKVMMILLCDYEFAGKLHIYTDNKTVVNYWNTYKVNDNISKFFESVEVTYIPREYNKVADKLCRERVLLDIPTPKYNEIVKIVKNK